MLTKVAAAGDVYGRIPPRIAQTQARTSSWWVVLSLLLVAGVTVLYFFNPSQHSFYPTCIFYKTTGLLCPGCGTLRGMHQLLHGHIEAAFRLNALIVSSLPLLALGCLHSARHRSLNKPAMAWIRPNWLWALLVILIVFGILRNLPGSSRYFLAP